MQVGNEIYVETLSFWNLVASKNPKQSFTEDDYQRYKELLYKTSAMHHHYDPRNQYPRASGSKKWKKVIRPIWNEFQMAGIIQDEHNAFDHDSLDGD